MSTTTDLTSNSFFEITDEAIDALRTDEDTIPAFVDDPLLWVDLLAAARAAVLYGGNPNDPHIIGLRNKVELVAEKVLEYVGDDEGESDEDEDEED